MVLTLTSSAFGQGEAIPKQFTCDGENRSPPLSWSGVPDGTQELLLVCDDPDAPSGTFHHWAIFKIPPDWTGLEAGYGPESLAQGLQEAVNDFGKPGYGGPCPPEGHGEHHYHFRLSALSSPVVSAAPGATCVEVIKLARPYVIEFTELVGLYSR